jgi:hypothetical protein
MKTKLIITILITIVAISSLTGFAGDVPADTTIKQKLLGYWRSGRHDYLYKADGIRYMLPRPPCTTTDHWDVKGGVYFEGSEPYDIVTLTKKTFAYRSRGADRITFTLKRITKEATQ